MRSNTTVHFRSISGTPNPMGNRSWRKGLSGTAAVVFVLMFSACAPSSVKSAPAIPHCAVLQAQALTSPNAPVSGVYQCLTPEVASANNFTSDADLQAVAAQPPVYTSYRYLGHTTEGYYFEFSSGQSVAGCFRFHTDATGHVDKAASKQGACPHPLP